MNEIDKLINAILERSFKGIRFGAGGDPEKPWDNVTGREPARREPVPGHIDVAPGEARQIDGDYSGWMYGGSYVIGQEAGAWDIYHIPGLESIYFYDDEVAKEFEDIDEYDLAQPVYRFSSVEWEELTDWWDEDQWEEVRKSTGLDPEQWEQKDIERKLVEAGHYFGFDEYDSSPERYTYHELIRYVPKLEGVLE
jgi:hypothetical protein